MKPAMMPLLTLVFAFGLATMARATDQTSHEKAAACDGFAWPVSNERAWFAAKTLRRSASGVRLARIDRAVDLRLEPSDKVRFFLPPQKSPRPGGYSGEVTFFGVPRPGLYQVTISRNASIDVFENGARLAAVATERGAELPGRASERALRPCARRPRSRSDQRRAGRPR